ncbi:putative membrane protein [Escherichia coli 3-020-07_S3_C2]|nr:putative membrane protein [Escherichia coli 2-460-02_S4_C2]KEJ62657.1 putative membrane protein [Escherichia coli 3-020-07_S3_C2]KEO33929.1 putative membrane protein [Escherichia coli 5-366-08_S4_C1]
MLWESSYPEIFLIPALSFSYLHGCQYIIILHQTWIILI